MDIESLALSQIYLPRPDIFTQRRNTDKRTEWFTEKCTIFWRFLLVLYMILGTRTMVTESLALSQNYLSRPYIFSQRQNADKRTECLQGKNSII